MNCQICGICEDGYKRSGSGCADCGGFGSFSIDSLVILIIVLHLVSLAGFSMYGVFQSINDVWCNKQSKDDLKAVALLSFRQFDNDGGGTIDKQELEAALRAFRGHPKCDELAHIFKSLNKSQEIDFREFHECLCGSGNSREIYCRLALVRESIDVLERGNQRTRVHTEMEPVQNAYTRNCAEKLFETIDDNGNGVLERVELRQMIEKVKEVEKDVDLMDLITAMEAKKDGEFNKEANLMPFPMIFSQPCHLCSQCPGLKSD